MMSKACMMAAVLLMTSISPSTLLAQNSSDKTVEQYTCKDVMRESGSNRDTAIAFLHGFLLGKSGTTKFNLETLTKHTDSFIDQCLDNPTEKALEAMTKVK